MNPSIPIRVWLDDVRDAPGGWVRAFTAAEAIALLEAGGVVEISLDHDLGDEAVCGAGYQVVCWIEEHVVLHGFERARAPSASEWFTMALHGQHAPCDCPNSSTEPSRLAKLPVWIASEGAAFLHLPFWTLWVALSTTLER
jgi:hypothetical protein